MLELNLTIHIMTFDCMYFRIFQNEHLISCVSDSLCQSDHTSLGAGPGTQ